MPHNSGKRLRVIIIIYWLFLFYIVAALIWWFISLQKQNTRIAELNAQQVNLTINKQTDSTLYFEKLAEIKKEEKRNFAKYVGEGSTFLLLSILGAVFVFRSVRKQFLVQQQQQNFMMAITHELKTPIAVARLNLETLQKHHLDEEKQKKIIQMTLQEITRLNILINNILISSQLEGGGYSFSKEELDFTHLLQDCIQDFRVRYPDRIFNDHAEPEIEVKGDALLLQIMINNLVENAIKYSAKEKAITFYLKKEVSNVVLNIIDEGAGIPVEEKKKIFEKFYRVGNEATRKTQGTGLGLYLCRKIAADHNADISVTNNIPHGSNFAITFHL